VLLLFMLPVVAGMTGMCHHTQIFSVEMGGGLMNFFARLASNYDPPNLSLPSS
jgi:hypothetical protein